VNVSRITLAGFTRYRAETVVELPDRGIVLVTGTNGSGKSSLVEAVSWGGWGRTLRGEDPWREDTATCRTRIETREGLDIARNRTKSRTTVDWSLATGGERTFETPTKAQQALEDEQLGPWDVWRRTCAFSSADASTFTMSSDADRKRLLEGILGLERFDEAVDQCRVELKALMGALDTSRATRTITQTRLDAEQRRRAESESLGAPPAGEDGSALEGELTRLRKLAWDTDRDLNEARASLRKADNAGAELDAALRAMRATLKAVRQDQCPTCSQSIAPALRDRFEQDYARVEHERDAQVRAARATVADVEAALQELEAERTQLVPRVTDVERRLATARATQVRRAQVDKIFADAGAAVVQLTREVAALDAKLAEGATRVRTLEACARVLGMKGVRAHVLGAALGGLEAVANGWLGRLAGAGLTLTLKAYTEQKSGKIEDKLALEVEGAGGGKGYKASSGGERRRIDLALLLSLGDVAAAAYGRATGGTVFADEVFDALDADGTARAVEVLEELSRDRCVVVLSHSDALIGSLSPALHLRVTDGAVVR
jgi:DNA repair exonuclease SbcCD ATPase subunit